MIYTQNEDNSLMMQGRFLGFFSPQSRSWPNQKSWDTFQLKLCLQPHSLIRAFLLAGLERTELQWNHPQWPLPVEQAEALLIRVAALMHQGLREMEAPVTGRKWSVTALEVQGRREFVTCPSPWPASAAVEHRFVSADIVAYMSHTLHWKFYLMSFEEKYFKQFYVFLYPGKKFENTSSPCGESFLFSSCQNTRVIWVFLSSFPDACFELMGLNRSNLLCWHFPPPSAQRVSLCRYIIISFPEETALLKIEQMGWEI